MRYIFAFLLQNCRVSDNSYYFVEKAIADCIFSEKA